MSFKLNPLPYELNAIEPYMSAETLEYHHGKHHQNYVNTLNKLLEDSDLKGKSLEEIIKESYNKDQALFNNAAQTYNHDQFWLWMKKGGGGNKLPAKLEKAFQSDLGGYDKFREDFIATSASQFGSGWAWVSVKDGKLEISKTSNAENPLVHGATPILGVDVWEHSYYIDYRNLRLKYLEIFVDELINWDYVLDLYEKAS